jgi:hypothetical protein
MKEKHFPSGNKTPCQNPDERQLTIAADFQMQS